MSDTDSRLLVRDPRERTPENVHPMLSVSHMSLHYVWLYMQLIRIYQHFVALSIVADTISLWYTSRYDDRTAFKTASCRVARLSQGPCTARRPDRSRSGSSQATATVVV